MKKMAAAAFGVLAIFAIANSTSAQGKRSRRTLPPPTSVPAERGMEPQIISRADDFKQNAGQPANTAVAPDEGDKSLDDLKNRVKNLESVKKPDSDANQKRLLLDLDILTRAEQRADSLRKQMFEMIEKESSIRTKLDKIENDIRPEAIDREIAFAGTMRPEELRTMRKKNLEIERTNLTALLGEVEKTKANLEQNVLKADLLVERFRGRLEKEMDEILSADAEKP